jgi:methylmalonyl-CoA mutase C-terminal domain/subunit
VIYTGLHQTVEQIVRVATQEGVDVIGVSIMSGAHIPICRRLLEIMKSAGLEDVPVVVGGVIPKQDIPRLKEMGIRGVFPGGVRFDEIVTGIRTVVH